MLDASRAVGVVSGLLSKTERLRARSKAEAATRADYVRIREQFARGQESQGQGQLGGGPGGKNRFIAIDWKTLPCAAQAATSSWACALSKGDLRQLRTALGYFIDWSPFFASWELVGRYPPHPPPTMWWARRRAATCGPTPSRCCNKHRRREAGYPPAAWSASGPPAPTATISPLLCRRDPHDPTGALHTLRPANGQNRRTVANLALSDFVAPVGAAPDYMGAFAVTAGHGEPEIAKRFKDAGDDYSAILAAALADRLAEAFAEALHRKVRTELRGYAPDETVRHRRADRRAATRASALRRTTSGPGGYTEKATQFKLLDAERNTGIALTESYAMTPPASVSGLYFSHPDAHYFGVCGKIDFDQVGRLRPRARGMGPVATAERWLAPDPQLRPRRQASGRGG